ncbi:MAG: hypothetical protein H6964_02455 [Chromatiaceae bacterium]|nr:hypothetical protein [Gammaproteobacteria bacterium]MCP5427887.1 hypothetical protein [Chromatiaceae bacterium]MCB1871182.1 hypothetical protein [Gammaproteobacteria bacterium]MCB1879405.1 hypothetical protein [Gammaproteobacteria bacterium]MCB1902634.1 hypothetical protein [Gammaproteobacteria bacterium]
MYKLLVVSILGLWLVACSDENMEKWKEMNKDRIQEAPKEDPNLPTVKGDVDAIKQKLKDINEKVQDKVNNMLEKKSE